jgi:hypothetical protein
MADDPKSLSQDEIDALVNQVAGGSSPAATPAKPSSDATAGAPPAKAAAPAGPLDQDAIDALINQVQPAPAPAPAPATAAPAGPLDQDAIDALINQVQPAPAPAPAPAKAAPASSGSLGQDDIDALINQVQAASAPAAAPAASSASAATVALDQDAIDALISGPAASGSKPSPNPAKPATGSATAKAPRDSSISQMLDSVQNAAKANAQAAGPGATNDAPSGPLGQDDIYRLLAELGANTASKAGPGKPKADGPSVPTTSVAEAARSQRPGTTSSNASGAAVPPGKSAAATLPSSSNAPTLALSPEDIDALVDRQVGVTSDHQEAPMIDQSDIDALVKQLASATNAPDTKKISDALAKHEGEIDKLLEQAGDAKVTMDAIPAAALSGSGSKAQLKGGMTATLAVPVMAPAELRGTRWLLAAAVLFLAVCAGTLGMVVSAINSLSTELKTQHQAALLPSNSFAEDYKAALAQLGAPDAGEVAKGVLFMGRLKARHPGHEAEIALALGRHFRAHGAFRQAAEEFAALSETGSGLFDDPRIFLDYAACLTELGDLNAAARQVYLLLANEDSYLAPRDRNGLTRPADEVTRNQQAVQDAYLTLGRMLAIASQQPGGRTTAKANSATHAAAGSASSSHSASPAAHAPSAPASAGHGGH